MILGMPERVGETYAGILAALVIATAVVLVKRRVKPGAGDQSLWDRTKSWWVMILGFGIALALGRLACVGFFALVSFGALKEYLTLVPTRRADRRVLFWAYLSIPIQYALISIGSVGIFTVFVPVYMFMILPMRAISVGQTTGFIRGIAIVHWAIMCAVYSLGHLAALLYLPETTKQGEATPGLGMGLMLFVMIVTQSNDIAAFVWGKSIGGPKVIPSVSPNKTWAGFVGGVLTTTIVGAALSGLLTPMELAQGALCGLFIGLFGFFGDATLSAVKRDLGVKDAGNLIPGHGGVLDRVNSLMFAAPVFFHFVRYYYF